MFRKIVQLFSSPAGQNPAGENHPVPYSGESIPAEQNPGEVPSNLEATPEWALPDNPLNLLRLALKSSPTTRRQLAAESLGEMGEQASEAIPDLVLAAADSNAQLRLVALAALPKIDLAWATHPGVAAEVAPVLVKKLDSMVDESRKAAKKILELIGEPGVPALIAGIETAPPESLLPLVQTLGNIGAGASAAAPALQGLFRRSANFLVREAILKTLGKLNLSLEMLKPTLLAGLQDAQSVVRLAAANLLTNVCQQSVPDSPAEAAIPALIATLADPDEATREQARLALAAIGNPAALPLIRFLENREGKRSQAFEHFFLEMQQFGERFQDGLYRRRSDLENSLLWHYETALETATRSEAAHVSALLALNKIPVEEGSWQAVLPVLFDLLTDKNPALRELAVPVLGKAESQAAMVSPILSGLLDQPHGARFHAKVWQALLSMNRGTLPESALIKMPVLVQSLANDAQRANAAEMLRLAGKNAVPVLLDGLASSDRILREEICKVLGSLARAAATAVPALQRLASDDPHRWVQEAAAAAVGKIETEEGVS